MILFHREGGVVMHPITVFSDKVSRTHIFHQVGCHPSWLIVVLSIVVACLADFALYIVVVAVHGFLFLNGVDNGV